MSCSCQSLAGMHPELLREWDWSANAIDPHKTRPGSALRAAWKCVSCGHSWKTGIYRRTARGTACPACAKADRLSSRSPQPLLQTARPDLVRGVVEVVDGTDPESLTCGSTREVVWICKRQGCRPDGCHHPQTWVARVPDRARFRACPYCAGRTVCPCNSLRAEFPEVASQWDHSRNKMGPDEVFSNSKRMVWWRDTDEIGVYVWRAAVKNRTRTYRTFQRLSKPRTRLVQR